jgi:hypothetical protein
MLETNKKSCMAKSDTLPIASHGREQVAGFPSQKNTQVHPKMGKIRHAPCKRHLMYPQILKEQVRSIVMFL